MFIDFRKRGREEREILMSERNIDQPLPVYTPTGDLTYSLRMCPDQELNLQPFGVWDDYRTESPGQGTAMIMIKPLYLNIDF